MMEVKELYEEYNLFKKKLNVTSKEASLQHLKPDNPY